MEPTLLELLRDPKNHRSLSLGSSEVVGDSVINGCLTAADGVNYPIFQGIPRFVGEVDSAQSQTRDAFAFKWGQRDTYDSMAQREFSTEWCVRKYGFKSLSDWTESFNSRSRILDVGCGSGFSSSLFLSSKFWTGRAMWVGADISTAIDVAQDRLGKVANTHFVQADALQLPFADETFEVIFSEGVLHHTPSTERALTSAARVLAVGGELQFYVYRRKGPVREFCDDYIRERLSGLSDAEAWEELRSLTKLAQILAEMKVTVEVPEDVPLLEIKAGRIDLQRFVYWNFLKLFWNSCMTFEENLHINFDWYRPMYAHRQTAEEIGNWCRKLNLEIAWFYEEESGYTVRATKSR